jgi:hypothetical protein
MMMVVKVWGRESRKVNTELVLSMQFVMITRLEVLCDYPCK